MRVPEIDRWLNWHPSDKKIDESPGSEPTKPTKPSFVSSVSSNRERIQNFLGQPAHDPAAWAEDFQRWALDRCCFKDRSFGGIGALHTNFCEYQIARNDVPCQRNTFEALLSHAGFFHADGLIYGLILKAEYKAVTGKPAPMPGRPLRAGGMLQ